MRNVYFKSIIPLMCNDVRRWLVRRHGASVLVLPASVGQGKGYILVHHPYINLREVR